MHHCCSKDELWSLLEKECNARELEDPDFSMLVDFCQSWQVTIHGFTLFLAQIIEKKLKDQEDSDGLINAFYKLEQQMDFVIQEFDEGFINYLLRTVRNPSLSLEEELERILINACEYRYEATVRC